MLSGWRQQLAHARAAATVLAFAEGRRAELGGAVRALAAALRSDPKVAARRVRQRWVFLGVYSSAPLEEAWAALLAELAEQQRSAEPAAGSDGGGGAARTAAWRGALTIAHGTFDERHMAVRAAAYPYRPMCGSTHGDEVIECVRPAARGAAEVVGYVALSGAYIDDVSVAPHAHGRGVAKALLCAAAARLSDRGEPAISLDVRSRNEPALAMYKALGFQAGEWRVGFYDWQGGFHLEAATAQLAGRMPTGFALAG